MNIARLFTRNLSVETLTHVQSAGGRLTRAFSDLLRNVVSLGIELQRLGIGSGDRVLILCGSRIEAVESILAIFNLGAVAMPLSPLIGMTNVLAVIREMSPTCCLFEDIPQQEVLEALDERQCVMIALRNAAATPRSWHRYDSLLSSGSSPIQYPEYPDEHPALIIHSSGSTGALKAVVMTHGALLRFFEYHEFVWSQYSDAADRLTGTSPVLTGLPLSHLAGLALCLQGLMSGRRTYLRSYFTPALYLRLIEEARCSSVMLVPSLYRSVLKEPYLQKMDKSALRFCVTGGESCPPELIEQIETAFGVPLLCVYSMTECLSGIGHGRRELFDRRSKRSSCGRQLFGQLKLCDPQGREHPDSGELWVRNSTVYECYAQPHLNQSRFHNGWYRTGDLFYRDEEGDFFHRGRADDMFICNGKNIYPLEMELLLMRHPAVESACAAPVTSVEKGTIPAALLVPKGSNSISTTEIQEFFMSVGPSHAIPRVVKLVDSMPVLGPGKLDRRRAAQMLQETYDNAPR
jgi:acyl-coenzyme A synthetase/AMP-(fatty) acid ligase